MIRIHTTMESLWLEPEELRTYNILGFCFLVQHAKRHYISEEQYHRETCPVYGTEEWRTRPYGSFYRAMHFCIELTMKNGERYLIDTGSNIFVAAEVGKQLISRIDDSAALGEKLTVIDIDHLLEASDNPPDTPVKLIFGKEAEELLAKRSGRQAKFLRTKDWQISIDPFECEISKTRAYFVIEDDGEPHVVSSGAYRAHARGKIYTEFFPEEEEEESEAEAAPLQIGMEYYVRIRTHGETYLLLTGYKEEENARWLCSISDWMTKDDPLLDLTAAASDSGGVPRLMSRGETQELSRFIYEYGSSPLLR